MSAVRTLLAHMEAQSLNLGDALADCDVRLYVDGKGVPHVDVGGVLTEGRYKFAQSEHGAFVVNLLSEFESESGAIGPDLRAPTQLTRIRPGILSGEPHILGTRIGTRSVAALRGRGFDQPQIAEMYPGVTRSAVRSALDLERRLASNARRLAA